MKKDNLLIEISTLLNYIFEGNREKEDRVMELIHKELGD